jgi:hypothetical protein
MRRRIEIDWALSIMTPKAVPAAPLPGEADVDRSSLLSDRDANDPKSNIGHVRSLRSLCRFLTLSNPPISAEG